MRVLVTGHRGYVGAVLVDVLRHARFEVVGLDCDLYGDCGFGRVADETPSFDVDIRQVEFSDLLSFDAVVHLAGLPEYFGRGLPTRLVDEIELIGTLRLTECSKQAQVERFVFGSSCSVYGRAGDVAMTEDDPAAPLSKHAQCKLDAERALLDMADASFSPVVVRCPTVYGMSPRLRLDTMVNDLVGSAVTRGRIDPVVEGRAWRSLVHVEDLCRGLAAILGAPDELVGRQTFNLAASDQSLRVVELADLAGELIPGVQRVRGSSGMGSGDGIDPEDCRVSGEKFHRAFPKFSFRWSLEQGIRQLRDALSAAGLSPGAWRGERYRRLMRLEGMLERGELDRSLRRAVAVGGTS